MRDVYTVPLRPSEADRHSQQAAEEQGSSCHLSRRVASLWVLIALLVLAFAVGAGEGPAEGRSKALLVLCIDSSVLYLLLRLCRNMQHSLGC